MRGEALLITAWLLGWVIATIFTAMVIGNTDNVHGSGDQNFPTFIIPLMFGWSWPAILALCLIIVPLSLLSDRATKRQRP